MKEKSVDKVPVDDYEINDMIKSIFERQKVAETEEKRQLTHKNLSEILNSTRDQRSLERYNQMVQKWKLDSSRVLKRTQRPIKNTVFARSEAYRRRKEIFDAIENNKPQSEIVSPSYAWKLSLRSEQRRLKISKLRSETHSPTQNNSYGSNLLISRTKSVRFQEKEENTSLPFPNARSARALPKDKKRCLNDFLSRRTEQAQNCSFGSGMTSQFVEPVGPHNSGLWVRVHSNDADLNKSQLIIRKSKSIYKQLLGDSDIFSHSLPKMILEKYRKFDKQREKKISSIFQNSQNYSQTQSTEILSSMLPKAADFNDHIPEDEISEIEVIGTSKLKSEAK